MAGRSIMPGAALAGVVLGAGLAWSHARPGIVRIERISRTVADLDVAIAFYLRLGFREAGQHTRSGTAHAALTGVPGLVTRTALLALGDQRLELRACRPAGAPYPADAGADDTIFQHCAIVVGDIDEAWKAIAPVVPIGQFGPQLLPGGVAAVKFRDPDGNPLELLQFPPGQGRACWHVPGDQRLFRGIDHSAITVRATQASLAFWRDALGLRVSSRAVNQGPAQQALDGVRAPLVRVTQLRAAQDDSMRVELLGYLSPAAARPPAHTQSNDIGGDRLVLRADDLDAACARLIRADAAFVSPGIVAGGADDGGRALLVRDPDGHDVLLTG